jgi:hypothetical protein
MQCAMIGHLTPLTSVSQSLLTSRGRLEAEVVLLPRQMNVLRRAARRGFASHPIDRLIFVWLYRLSPSLLNVVSVDRLGIPEHLIDADLLAIRRRMGFKIFLPPATPNRSPALRAEIAADSYLVVRP